MIQTFKQLKPMLGQRVYIAESATVIGDVVIGDDSSVWPSTVIRGDINTIRIGKSTNIQDGSVLHVTHDSSFVPGGFPLIIGDHVTIGHRVVLHACTISDFALVGMGSIILDGAYVHPRVLIGAGSLVPPGKELTSGHLWLGSPVKKIRSLTDEEMAYFEYSAKHYQKLKDEYLAR